MAVRKKNKTKSRKNKKVNIQKVKTIKLAVMMIFILLAFAGLGVRLFLITRDNQTEYQKKILSQQRYDSKVLPFKRGTITDANGTILASSEKVYNVIMDNKVILDDEKNQAPTVSALSESFGLNSAELNAHLKENPTSQYYVLKKRIPYEEMKVFLDKQDEHNKNAAKNKELGKIKGVWFEEEYIRRYPNNTLACDVIGFAGIDNNGQCGLEKYYDDVLNGTNGREYGYLNDDATLERTTVAAVDGNSLVTTIDANIQAIVEKYLLQFNDEHMNEYREGNGATNIGCIVMNPNNGEIKAMASYPNFDLNNPKDLTKYYSDEEIAQMEEDETYYETLNKLWRNFCISDTYEPGSTAKALTLAAGIEAGKIIGNETYDCGGALQVANYNIKCNVRSGHGVLDVSGSLEQSCNVAFMKMGEAIGVTDFTKFQQIFNIGLKTNIDLEGEARTASLVYTKDTMGPTELATCSFGQGFNVTMIEMAAAFSSVVNGGYYYEPHVVSKIVNSNGDTVRNIEPRLLKQTVSASTSEMLRQYLYATVDEGTGKSARPAGYAIGGKTGTAEKAARDDENYVVSFIGFAPIENPQLVIYVVIDEPNVDDQPHASFATGVVKNILTEVLPYMHIGKTEEMTIAEQEEVENVLNSFGEDNNSATEDESDTSASQENNEASSGENVKNPENSNTSDNPEDGEGVNAPFYVVDPETGELIDAVTGEHAQMSYDLDGSSGDGTENDDTKNDDTKNDDIKNEAATENSE